MVDPNNSAPGRPISDVEDESSKPASKKKKESDERTSSGGSEAAIDGRLAMHETVDVDSLIRADDGNGLANIRNNDVQNTGQSDLVGDPRRHEHAHPAGNVEYPNAMVQFPFVPPPPPPPHYPGYHYYQSHFPMSYPPPYPSPPADQAAAWANMAAMYANAAQMASQAAASCVLTGSHNNGPGSGYWDGVNHRQADQQVYSRSKIRPPFQHHSSDPESDQRARSAKNVNRPNRRRARWQSSDSSSSGGSWRRPPAKKKAVSLVGKTGVAALFEWSNKRDITPTLTLQYCREDKIFECIVYLPASEADKEVLQEWGKGKGLTKAYAKQEAARNAINALFPTVEFDPETGVITGPDTLSANHSLDELPALASQIINRRRSNEDKKCIKETTTRTSEDDSESAYLAREGAGVCSQLLHTMIQIDPERLPSNPVFLYETPTAQRLPFKCTGHLETRDDLLSAVGVGGTKREARHVVSAQLLAQLFPQCNNMAAVKEAAEAVQEEYARGRELKQAARAAEAAKRHAPAFEQESLTNTQLDVEAPSEPCEANEDDVVEEDLASSVSAVVLDENPRKTQSKRRKYSDEFERALLLFNRKDGTPDECDDVGRTILRRAESADWPRILKLFSENPCDAVISSSSPADGSEAPVQRSRVALLLCRAIAAYEDPPLGCAVISKDADDRLSLVQMVTEHHLPEERFLECLESFSKCMDCSLESLRNAETYLSLSEIGSIVGCKADFNYAARAQLQSVAEESEEDSAEESRPKKRCDDSNKVPSKRSRVQ